MDARLIKTMNAIIARMEAGIIASFENGGQSLHLPTLLSKYLLLSTQTSHNGPL